LTHHFHGFSSADRCYKYWTLTLSAPFNKPWTPTLML